MIPGTILFSYTALHRHSESLNYLHSQLFPYHESISSLEVRQKISHPSVIYKKLKLMQEINIKP